MTDNEIPDGETPPKQTGDGGARRRDWIAPAAVLGAVALLAVAFAGGFLVGRNTAPQPESVITAEVLDDLHFPHFDQERFPFHRFRTPGNRGFDSAPERGPFGGRGPLAEGALERLCGLLEDGLIPDEAPFSDRLADACADRA